MHAHLLVRDALLAGPRERHRDVEEVLGGAAVPEQSAEHGLARCARQGAKGRPEHLGGRVTRSHAASPPRWDRSMSGPAIPQLNQRESSLSVIRALLRQQGARVPSGSAEGFIQRVRALPLPGWVFSVIAPLLAVMGHLNRQLPDSDAT